MKAMIFAAGLGTRLKPITDTMPKAMVPVCGKPLIEHVALKLKSSGITDAVVNVHHFADQIKDWVAAQEIMPIAVSDESARLLETGGAVLKAREYLEGCGSFLIHNVDIFSNADLGWLASQVRPEALATLLVSERKTTRFLLFHPDDLHLVGWLNTDQNDYHLADPSLKVEDCIRYAFSGIYILSEKVLDVMEDYVAEKDLPRDEAGVRFPIMSFFMWAARKYPMYGVVCRDLNFLDVGKIDTLEQAERSLGDFLGE